jgi:hypothetical protein
MALSSGGREARRFFVDLAGLRPEGRDGPLGLEG